MMACSRNLSKHLKISYQTKINMEMFQHDFQFFANLMTFFSKKKIKYSLFILFFIFVQNLKPKKNKPGHVMFI
jgi:hypothetical protein